MAARKKADDTIPTQAAKTIVPTGMQDEVSKSFLEYSMSVVYSRALPDIQDGMKPVQRRIMYAMHLDGNTPDKSFVKSAKPVASAMGNFHPHGDSSIYSALVRLAQPFAMNVPLVEGYGNFGDVTGSPAAASRYTECRMSKEAPLLLNELKEETVPMKPNYSGDMIEPVYLPCAFPNLLVNGNFGIAVGFASNFAPMNSTEVMNACKVVLKNRNATLDQVMKVMPGPDFPTGGLIVGEDGIRQAFETGRGLFKIRSRATVNPMGRGRHEIVFNELPYGANVEAILKKLKDGLKAGKFLGVADAKDLTDKNNGLRFVVETKAGINPDVVLLELYKETPLEETFGVNNTVLVDGSPKTVGVMELIHSFLDHRTQVVLNRSTYRKEKREARLHLVEGLLKALTNIDAVIKIVRNADDAPTAQGNLMTNFKISEVQADHILSISLRRLTKYDQIALSNEKDTLEKEIAELASIINDEAVRNALIMSELDDTKKAIARDRKSTLVDGALAEHVAEAKKVVASSSLTVEDGPCIVSLTRDGKVVRGDKAARNAVSTASTTTRGRFLVVTDSGRAMRIEALHVGEKAHALASILPEPLARDEKVLAVSPLELEAGKVGGLVLGTSNGIVKVQDAKWPKTQDVFDVITLDEGAKILGARWVPDNTAYDFVFIASTSNMLRSPVEKIRPQGSLSAAGVSGFKFAEEDTILEFAVVSHEEIEAGALVVSVSDAGNAKFTPLKNYPQKGRGGIGVRTYKTLKGETAVAYSEIAVGALVLVDADGKSIDPLPTDERRDGSGKPLGGVPVR